VITGGTGADIITGGDGIDTLTGGSGIDTYIVDADDSASVSVANDASTGSDTITDFVKASDKIKITGELADGFTVATDVVIGSGNGTVQSASVATAGVFLTSVYLAARDGDVTNGFDTAINAFSSGTTAAFSSAAEAKAATMFDVTLAAGATVVLGANNDKAVGSTGDDTITGGAGIDTLDGAGGDDIFIIAASDDAVGESYTGGAGTADKLDVNGAANLSNDTIATIEILDLDASGNAFAVTMTAAQVDGFTTIASAASNISTGDIITLSDAMTAAMLDGTQIGASSVDEVVFVLADVASNALTLVDATLANASDVLYIDGSGLTGTNALTFSAAAETDAAALTIVGGAAVDTITGGAGVDTITGGPGADLLNGGAGADVFVVTTTSTAAPSATVFDTITGFATASDKIDYAANISIVTDSTTLAAGKGQTASTGLLTFHADDDTLAERIIATEASIQTGTAANGQAAMFDMGSDTFLFISDGVDGIAAADTLIKLVGIDTSASGFDTITLQSSGATMTLA
jgi:Ca2+-binding RTX toxin-like protein